MTPRPCDLEDQADAMEAEASDCNSVRDRDDLLDEAEKLRRQAWHMRREALNLDALREELKTKDGVS